MIFIKLIETPWSTLILFSSSKGNIYLKQPAILISKEARIIQVLADQFHASVPSVIAINNDLHCFLMEDAGISLRLFLKARFQPDLLCQSIIRFTSILLTAM